MATMKSNVIIASIFLYVSFCCAGKHFTPKHNEDEDLEMDKEESPRSSKYNETVLTPATRQNNKGEIVVEKFVESLMSSEKYLKIIETIEDRMTHLESIFHERSNSILKYLLEVLRAVKNPPAEVMERAFKNLKHDLDRLKFSVSQKTGTSPTLRVEDGNCNLEGALDSRLSFLETNMKTVANGVEAITAVISEVKNRQKLRTFNKNDQITGTIDATNLISEFRRVLMEQKPKKCDCKLGRVDRSERYPTDCQEIQAQGFNVTGIYKIKPEDMEPFYVLCDLNTVGGGWTIIQNRFDGSQDFYKNWNEYKHGFGNLASEFWLGLEKVYYLTNQKLYELRVEMETQIGQEASATFSVFTIGPEYESYRISTLGTYRGNAGDSLSYHAGQKFSTYEVDNDEWKDGSCAVEHGGAWWYKECDKSNLNGKYLSGAEENNGQAVYWISFKGPNSPLSKTRMMIRPLPASRPQEYTEQLRKLSENPKPDVKRLRGKEMKSPYDGARARAPYRYEDNVRQEVFFPNYT